MINRDSLNKVGLLIFFKNEYYRVFWRKR